MGRGKLAVLVTMAIGLGTQASGAEHLNVRLQSDAMRGSVERTLGGAARRLERPACQRLLSEFVDAQGRPLQENLAQVNQTAVEYLGGLFFYDGASQGRCASPGILAVTQPGGRAIRICSRFFDEAVHNPQLAEAVIIHEALHTLGLGENPPSSQEITARVLKHCH
jgi:hypothetical protein